MTWIKEYEMAWQVLTFILNDYFTDSFWAEKIHKTLFIESIQPRE
jgi:hypothetical protein